MAPLQYRGARVLAVGHRVVHGGARYRGPVVVTPQVLEDLRTLIPLAPLHQPYNLAAIEAVVERMPKVPQVACFDTSFHRGQPAVAELVPLPREVCRAGVQRYGFHGLSYEYIASVLPKVAPEIAGGRVIVAHLGSGASLCALREREERRQHAGVHRARRALHGHPARRCRSRRDPLPLPGPQALGQGRGNDPLQEVRACSASQESATTCAICSASAEPGARLAVDYFVYRAAKEIGALAAVLGGIDGWSSLPASARTLPRFAAGSAGRRPGSASSWTTTANARQRPADHAAGSVVSAWVIPTNEELMIARQTATLLGLIEARLREARQENAEQASHENTKENSPRKHENTKHLGFSCFRAFSWPIVFSGFFFFFFFFFF